MIVKRLNLQTQEVIDVPNPIIFNFGLEPIVITIDQSSTGTGVTIGTRGGSLKEVLCFFREKNKSETTEGYLMKLGDWLKVMVSKLNVIDFSNERFNATQYHHSDRIAKQVLGKIKEVYDSAYCLNSEGEPIRLKDNAVNRDIISKSWQAAVVPKEIRKRFSKEDEAYHHYATTILRGLLMLGVDASASICMYLYLLKTQYSEIGLEPDKANISRKHSLVWYAIPFLSLTGQDEHLQALGDPTAHKYNREQLKYISEYRLTYVKRFFDIFLNIKTDNEMYLRYKEQIDKNIGDYLRGIGKRDTDLIAEEIQRIKENFVDTRYRNFNFNDKLSAEDNLRALTGSDYNVYYTEITQCLHYCYLLPMFDIKLRNRETILSFGMRF